jgi:hypothetical protein
MQGVCAGLLGADHPMVWWCNAMQCRVLAPLQEQTTVCRQHAVWVTIQQEPP